jgi:hypothetical protein
MCCEATGLYCSIGTKAGSYVLDVVKMMMLLIARYHKKEIFLNKTIMPFYLIT